MASQLKTDFDARVEVAKAHKRLLSKRDAAREFAAKRQKVVAQQKDATEKDQPKKKKTMPWKRANQRKRRRPRQVKV